MEREEPVTMATLPNIVVLDKSFFFFFSHKTSLGLKFEGKNVPCKYVVATKEEDDENC